MRKEVGRQARQIRESNLRSPLEIEIVSLLIEGRRTARELTEEIYDTGSGGHLAVEYARVRRCLKGLEARGYVAAATIFGRERPYRLTRFGVSRLLDLAGLPRERLVPLPDLFLHICTLGLFVSMVLGASLPGWFLLLSAFMAGASTLRVLELVKRVS